MSKKLSLSALAISVALSLSACKNDYVYVHPDPEPPKPPEVEKHPVTVWVRGDLSIGSETTFEAECESCFEASVTQLVVDSNDNGIFGDVVEGVEDRVIEGSAIQVAKDELGKKISVLATYLTEEGADPKERLTAIKRMGVISNVEAGHYGYIATSQSGAQSIWANKYILNEFASRGVSVDGIDISMYRLSKLRGFEAATAIQTDGSGVFATTQPTRATYSIPSASGVEVKEVHESFGAIALVREDGSVEAYGDASAGGEMGAVAITASNPALKVVAARSSFAALLADGSVETWGAGVAGGVSPVHDPLDPAVDILAPSPHATSDTFVIIKQSGVVETWGATENGGGVSFDATNPFTKIVHVNELNTWAGIHADGAISVWGADADLVTPAEVDFSNLNPAVDIIANDRALAVLRADESVEAWGDPENGGNVGSVDLSPTARVVKVVPTSHAFSALRMDGSVVSWGAEKLGGVQGDLTMASNNDVVDLIAGHSGRFVAVAERGAYSWGRDDSVMEGLSSTTRLSPAPILKHVFGDNGEHLGLDKYGELFSFGASWGEGQIGEVFPEKRPYITLEATGKSWATIRSDGSAYLNDRESWGSLDFQERMHLLDGKNSQKEVPKELVDGVSAELLENPIFAVWKELKN